MFTYWWQRSNREEKKNSMIQRREGLTGHLPGSPGGVAKTPPNAGGTGSIPGQGIRFHMPQLRV